MSETAIPDSNAIADAMLKRTGEILREQRVSALRLASYFSNEAPEGEKPRYAEVGEQYHGDSDVFPLYFAPADSRALNNPADLTAERISELWNGMPGGCSGFMRQWGYLQFARAVEAEVRAILLATHPQSIASGEPS